MWMIHIMKKNISTELEFGPEIDSYITVWQLSLKLTFLLCNVFHIYVIYQHFRGTVISTYDIFLLFIIY